MAQKSRNNCYPVANGVNARELNIRTAAHTSTRLAAAALLCGMIFYLAAPASAARSNAQDTAFVRKTSQEEIGNVQIAELALRKSGNRRVVSFATRIRDVDSQLHRELMSISHAQRVPFPSAIGRNYQSQLAQLQPKTGYDFNMDYLRAQLRADEQALSSFKREVANGSNTYVMAFAKETIPVLDQHVWLAQQAIASVKHMQRTVSRSGR